MAKWDLSKLPEGRKPLPDEWFRERAQMQERIAGLEAENKLLNEQMAAIEEHGNEMLNALPDCLMKLAPALVENDELKAKLAKAVDVDLIEQAISDVLSEGGTYRDAAEYVALTTLAELKGEDRG
jgi:hypothetical protein